MARVPHFASILPHVIRMEPGLAEVTVAAGVDLVVPVRVTDRSGAGVVHAEITTWMTPAAENRRQRVRRMRRDPTAFYSEIAY
jgi:hypothetical protein